MEMPKWRNWSGKLESRPEALRFLRSEVDAQALVRAAVADGRSIRAAGATHSHAPLVGNDGGIIADLSGLAGIVAVDPERLRATVWGGSRLFALGNALHQHGLAFSNQGDIDQQAIAGATATGTHGTGQGLKNFSAAVTGLRLVTGAGEIMAANEGENAEVWEAARLHLGAFGLVSQVELQLVPCYRLRERSWTASLDEVLEQSEQEIAANRHFEFFWYPQVDEANAKAINETDDDPVYPLAQEGARCAWSHEVLPNHRPVPHTEMEYSVPAAAGVSCMRDLQKLLQTRFSDVQWPVEFRTLAADDVWLSTAYRRDTVTLSVHLPLGVDDEPYYRACEEIFLAHDGRPHWGKVHYLNGDALAARHPRWADWWEVRDRIDPAGTFLNPYLTGLRK
jgi:FAD/FMN-containing dehydrogenase